MAGVEPTTSFQFHRDDGTPYRLDVPLEKTFIFTAKPPVSTGMAVAIGSVAFLALAGVVRGQVGSGARRGDLTDPVRAGLDVGEFAVPSERKYPIHDHRHGQLALTFVAAPSNANYRYRVMSRVFPRYPDLINWWATTKPGQLEPLTEQFFRDQIKKYRSELKESSSTDQKEQIEDEISALQVLISMVPRLKVLAQRQARRKAQ